MSIQQYEWLASMAIVAWLQSSDEDQGDPLSIEMKDVVGVAGRLPQHERRAANEELVAALIMLLIYAWNCAKYRARIGVFDRNRAKFPQNVAPLFFGAQFALTRVITELHETRADFSDPLLPCQMNSSPPLTAM